jgi:hypothetical protein
MANADECSASEYADIVERSAAKFRSACKSSPPRSLQEQRARFEAELQKELERRTAARAQGAAARPEVMWSNQG